MEIFVAIAIIGLLAYGGFWLRKQKAKRVAETAEMVEELEQSEDKDISYRASLLRERMRRERMREGSDLTGAFIDIEGEVIALWKTEQRFKKPPE